MFSNDMNCCLCYLYFIDHAILYCGKNKNEVNILQLIIHLYLKKYSFKFSHNYS